MQEAASGFTADAEPRERQQAEVKVVEMAAMGPDKLMVLEQIDKASRFYVVTLNEAHRVPPEFDSPETTPNLEVFDEAALRQRMLTPLPKALVLDSEKSPGLPARIEGFAILSPGEIVVINDNDFSIDGVRTQVFRITLPVSAGRSSEAPQRDDRMREERSRTTETRSVEK
jgi:Esterase-like activity of phytase